MSSRPSDREPNDAMSPSLASAVLRLPSPPTTSPGDVERVMVLVRRRHTSMRRRRASVGVMALAASLLIAASLFRRATGSSERAALTAESRPVVHVRVAAPHAQRLALVGDFNSWDMRTTPMTRDAATGVWVASIALAQGRYLYAFVADGERWFADPNAPLASTDDFARQNSVLVVSSDRYAGIGRWP